jgi:hypothetical protein
VSSQRVEDNAFHLGIREKDRSARESHELARMILFLGEFSRPFAPAAPACHVVALAKTEASRGGGLFAGRYPLYSCRFACLAVALAKAGVHMSRRSLVRRRIRGLSKIL